MARNELVMSDAEIATELGSGDDTEAVESTEASDDSNPELEFDEDTSDWEDKPEGDVDAEAGDAETAAATQPQLRKIKADGKLHEVNMADQNAVDQLLSLGLGARRAFSERDALRKKVQTFEKQLPELQRYQGMWKRLDAMKSDHDALYEAVFGRKFDDTYAERKDYADRYEAASPEMRTVMDERKKLEAERRADLRKRADEEGKAKDLDAKAEQAEIKEFRAQLLPEFHRHEFSEKVDDPALAEKLNAMLWKTTISNLKGYDNVTPEIIRREFRATADVLAGAAKKQAQAEVKKVVADKKKNAREQAKVAATRNHSVGNAKDLSKEKDPVKLFRRMFPKAG